MQATPAAFETVSPGVVPRGTAEVTVTIGGTLLSGLDKVQVRNVEGEWSTLDAVPRSATELALKLPRSLLTNEGFFQIGPEREAGRSLAFLVSTPGLPVLGTAQLEPIRCLQYFVPVVDELLTQPPLPEYLDYLKHRLIGAGVLPA